MKLVQMKKKSKAQAMRDMKQVGIDNNVIVWQSNFPFLAGRSNSCSKSEGYELPPSETHNSYALSGA